MPVPFGLGRDALSDPNYWAQLDPSQLGALMDSSYGWSGPPGDPIPNSSAAGQLEGGGFDAQHANNVRAMEELRAHRAALGTGRGISAQDMALLMMGGAAAGGAFAAPAAAGGSTAAGANALTGVTLPSNLSYINPTTLGGVTSAAGAANLGMALPGASAAAAGTGGVGTAEGGFGSKFLDQLKTTNFGQSEQPAQPMRSAPYQSSMPQGAFVTANPFAAMTTKRTRPSKNQMMAELLARDV